jgi:hypothetical protein
MQAVVAGVKRQMRRNLVRSCLVIALGGGMIWAQSIGTAPAPTKIAPLGPQRPQPPARPARSPVSALAKAQAPIAAPNAGNVEGFVYWDASSVAHKPTGSCSGLAVTVSVGSTSGGPLEAYKPMATLNNNFKYAGQVKAYLSGGRVTVYDVCMYAYDHVPVGPDLQVKLTVVQALTFSPVVAPQVAILGPIKIINGQCNMLPAVVPRSASDLTSHWGSCQNRAYDVNFALVPSAKLTVLSSSGNSGGLAGGSRGIQVANKPGPNGAPLLKNPGPAGTLLSKNPGPQGIQAVRNPGPAEIQALKQPGPMGSPSSGSPGVAPVTNADVIKLLRGGVPELVIISKIQSAQRRFDFSPAGCRSLAQAHVSPKILDAMGDGSVRPCFTGGVRPGAGADDLNPQPLPPKGIGAASKAKGGSGKFRPVAIKTGPPKALRKISNPRLSQQNAAIIAVLQQQRQAANKEWGAMKLGIRPAAAIAPAAGPIAGARNTVPASLAVATTVQRNATLGAIGPERTASSSRNGNSAIGQLPAFNMIVVTCSHDPTPRILRVSGGEGPGVFTPEAKYNLYTITGCNFGPSAAGNSVYIYGGNGFRENLYIDFWSENGITVHMDPALAGVLDQNNVTLVVAPSGQQPFEKAGFRFYAARGMPGSDGSPQEVSLAYNSVLPSQVSLFNVSNFPAGLNQLPSSATSKFPSFSFQGTPVAGWVFRYAYEHDDRIATFRAADCFINDVGFNGDPCKQFYAIGYHYTLPPGQWQLKSDTWDFSKLAPGFQISSYQLFVSTLDPASLCGSWDDLGKADAYLDGDWDYNLNPQNQIVVTWPIYRCGNAEFGTRNNMAIQSAYGLAVGVMGPRCVNPWTGQKDQACMTKIQQSLGL